MGSTTPRSPTLRGGRHRKRLLLRSRLLSSLWATSADTFTRVIGLSAVDVAVAVYFMERFAEPQFCATEQQFFSVLQDKGT